MEPSSAAPSPTKRLLRRCIRPGLRSMSHLRPGESVKQPPATVKPWNRAGAMAQHDPRSLQTAPLRAHPASANASVRVGRHMAGGWRIEKGERRIQTILR